MSLNEELNQFREESDKETPKDVLEKMAAGQKALETQKIIANARRSGQQMEPFNLNSVKGYNVSLRDLLHEGPVVITFYRGSWCPYCNLELQSLQNHLGELESTGAKLVAISPEKPDDSLTALEKFKLAFEVLHDENNALARKLGLVFEVPNELVPIYKEWDIDIKQSNGADKHELPLASTFLVNTAGIIEYAFHNADYTKRMEPRNIIDRLKDL